VPPHGHGSVRPIIVEQNDDTRVPRLAWLRKLDPDLAVLVDFRFDFYGLHVRDPVISLTVTLFR
jgi:hypothetical protein